MAWSVLSARITARTGPKISSRDRHVVADVGEDRRFDPETALELRGRLAGLTAS
jgi:hypothetical protein